MFVNTCAVYHRVSLVLQLSGDMTLAVADALAASLSCHLDGCLKRTSDGAECTAALQSAAPAVDGIEAGSETVQLSVGEAGGGSSILLGTERCLPIQAAVTRMLRSASAGSSSAADAAANLRALTVLVQLPIRGAPPAIAMCLPWKNAASIAHANGFCAGPYKEQAFQPSIVSSLVDGDLPAWLRVACSQDTDSLSAAAAFSLFETVLVPAAAGASSQVWRQGMQPFWTGPPPQIIICMLSSHVLVPLSKLRNCRA